MTQCKASNPVKCVDDLTKASVAALAGLFLIAEPSIVWAASTDRSCLIRIDGAIYDAAPCNMNSEDDDIISFGHFNDEAPEGYWVYLIRREDGRYDGYWNDDFGAGHAHSSLGVLSREDRAGSDCFSNPSTLLCRNILFDTPVYDVEIVDY